MCYSKSRRSLGIRHTRPRRLVRKSGGKVEGIVSCQNPSFGGGVEGSFNRVDCF